MRPIRRAVARLLKAGQTCGVAKTEGVCREVLKVYDALWTFVRVEGVEPTRTLPSARSVRVCCGAKAALGRKVPTGPVLWRP